MGAMTVSMAVRQQPPARRNCRGFGKELLQQRNQGRPAHHEAAGEQYAADAQRTQALHLSVAAGEATRGWLERPADRGEGHDVADKVGEAVYGVGGECCVCMSWCKGAGGAGGAMEPHSPWLLKT